MGWGEREIGNGDVYVCVCVSRGGHDPSGPVLNTSLTNNAESLRERQHPSV